MDVFKLRESLKNDYRDYVRSFTPISDARINDFVESEFDRGVFWPEPLVQLNPTFQSGEYIDEYSGMRDKLI